MIFIESLLIDHDPPLRFFDCVSMTPAFSPDDAASSMGTVAREAAHALNNVTGVLFAALDHLEEPLDARSADRARKAIDRACASTLALSAAFSLLGLGPDDAKAALARQPATVEPSELARTFDLLFSVCGVAVSAGEPAASGHRIRMDRDTLQAVLMCAAACLKYSGGSELSLQWGREASPAAVGGVPRIRFDMLARQAADGASAPPRKGAGQHPCALALSHARDVLAPLGLVIHLAQQGAVSVAIDCVPEAP